MRVWKALGYSLKGLPLLLAAPWVGRNGPEVLALVGVVLLIWVVELLNSALEALADAISVERRELLGRAKDLGSAAVLFTLIFAAAVWGWVIWQRWGP